MFYFDRTKAESIVIRSLDKSINFLTQEGFAWLAEHITSEKLEIKKGEKSLQDRNAEIFQLIRQGAIITQGELYKSLAF